MTTLQNIQITEGPFFFGYDGALVVTGNTAATVAPATFRDSTNSMTMITTVTTTLSTSSVALNALDTGTVAASTFYAVYMVADVQNRNPTGFLISTSTTGPVLPQGYSCWLRIGWLLTDGSSHLLKFQQAGNGGGRWYQWQTAINVLSAGTSATFAAVSLATAMPLIANPVRLIISYTPNTAGNTVLIRPTGSTETSLTPIQLTGVVAAKAQIVANQEIITLLSSGNPSIDYELTSASDSCSIWVSGFNDYIGI